MVDVDDGVDMAIGIFVVLILGASLLPTAFDQIFNASQANWTGPTKTLWDLLPLMGILGVVLMFVYWAKSSGKF